MRCFTESIVGYNVISPSISKSGGHSLILDLELCDFAPFPATDMLDRDPSVPSLSLSGQSNQQSNVFANPEDQNDNLDLANLTKQARDAFAIIELCQ